MTTWSPQSHSSVNLLASFWDYAAGSHCSCYSSSFSSSSPTSSSCSSSTGCRFIREMWWSLGQFAPDRLRPPATLTAHPSSIKEDNWFSCNAARPVNNKKNRNTHSFLCLRFYQLWYKAKGTIILNSLDVDGILHKNINTVVIFFIHCAHH